MTQQTPSNELQVKEYTEYAERTLSDKFYIDQPGLPVALKSAVEEFIAAGQKLDKFKKVLFYGKDISVAGEVDKTLAGTYLTELTEDQQKVFHAAVGIATEATEILEQVHNSYANGTELDVANLGEEIGDGFWYNSILFRTLKLNFNKILYTNIAKLAKRYGDKFTEFRADNRDLNAEREILNKGV